MYELNIANKNYSSWSLRPWLLMKQLNIPFREHVLPLQEGGGPGMFNHISPSGKLPCLVDDNIRVWDSLAITEYLAEIHPEVWPGTLEARSWARSAAAEMHAGFAALRSQCTMNCGVRVKMAGITPELQRDLDRLDALWQEGIRRFGGPFLAGSSFSAVDAFFAPVAFRIQTYDLPLGDTSLAYARHLLALEPMQRWYDAALREPWRHPAYDAVTQQAGEWLADHRL